MSEHQKPGLNIFSQKPGFKAPTLGRRWPMRRDDSERGHTPALVHFRKIISPESNLCGLELVP
jgi:hypothetical protein